MNLAEYRQHVEAIPYGKRLPSALYVFRADGASLGEKLDALLTRVAAASGADARHNVIKFRLDELKVSFLAYPEFMTDPHPELHHAITVDLATGKSRQTDYTDNINPPILHRKESFLPPGHARRGLFAALTASEEEAGLYEQTRTIGFKLNWERLLKEKGVIIRRHKLQRVEVDPGAEEVIEPFIERHKTALTRYELSKPVKSLLEYGLLRPSRTFFDYGCGQGSDMRGLQALGYDADGWDPVHRHTAPKREADVVNLGYVLNVIEDPAERLEALVDAFRHARRLLVVSALIHETVETEHAAQFRDGVVTKRNTFQKYFEQQELQQFIEDALDVTAVPVALGSFYVFREPTEQQDFLSARSRRTIDWTQIAARLGLGQPRKSKWELLYEQHKELLDAFWAQILQSGRLPTPEEFPRFAEIGQAVGTAKRALKLFVKRGGAEVLAKAQEGRRNDLLVYLAMSNLRKRVPFGHLSQSLRLDIRSFFANHTRALEKGLDLLYAAGDVGELELACEELKVGWQNEQAFYLHRSLLEELPPVLRAYVGCATTLFGDVAQADVIKIHKASGKVTFLVYDDFQGKPLPELRQRIKVNLRTRWVQVFDHSAEKQLLYFKERYVGPNHPKRDAMEKFSAKLRRLGVVESLTALPSKAELQNLIAQAGLNENLNRKKTPSDLIAMTR